MSSPVGSIDWTTVFVSLAAAFVVAVGTYFFNERSNVKAFRRQQLYQAKVQAYLELLSAFDTQIDALEILHGGLAKSVKEQVANALKADGVVDSLISTAMHDMDLNVIPRLQKALWAGIGYVESESAETAENSLPHSPSGSPAYSISSDPSFPDLVRFLTVSGMAIRRSNAAYAHLGLLQIPESLGEAIHTLSMQFTEFGTGGAAIRLAQGPAAAYEDKIQAFREAWVKLSEECTLDLETVMS